jgi:hypothetical protein
MMRPVIAHELCRCPCDGKMEGALVPETRARNPTGRRRAVPLAKENIALLPRPTELVLDPHAHERREEL